MIHLLDQKTIDKIAAGEVIERPASIVKELVENSIDAKADRVTVEIKDGGISMIRVTDNGVGISAEEVQKAFLRHATSKLETIEDLIGVETLGFRGEALSTISAVTQTEMITKTHEALTGIKYVIHGGTEIECKEIGAPDGTTIVSRNIFYNTPARLKFLKSSMTEGSYISDLMSHIALSHPEVSVTLINNGKTVVDTAGNGKLKDTIYTLYGRDITGGLLPVDYAEGELKVTGFIGKPYLNRGNRSFENYFVNGRYIKSQIVNRAIEEAYKTYIMQHRFPFTVLFLELPGDECDVNVHPTKREFKYKNEKALFSVVFHAIFEALKEKTHIPDMNTDYGTREKAYRGNPELLKEPGTTYHTEKRTPVTAPNTDTPKTGSGAAEEAPFRASQTAYEAPAAPSEPSRAAYDTKSPVDSAEPAGTAYDAKTPDAPDEPAQAPTTSLEPERIPAEKPASSPANDAVRSVFEKRSASASGSSYSILEALMPKDFREKLKENEEKRRDREAEEIRAREEQEQKKTEVFRQAALTDTEFLSEEAEPEILVIGQVFRTYWLMEYKDCLYLMDQHAAHEKVNYERFLQEFKTRTIHSQRIFPPKLFTLTAAEKTAVLGSLPLLEKAGFELEDFGGNEVRLTALPANLLGLSGEDVFAELVSYISSGIDGVTEEIFVHKLATMGCKAAIKGNQRITFPEIQTLMKELLTLDNPYTCPHGRPTIIRMTKEDLDRKFKRIVE